jgi:cellulose synthase/poly-beta-1,6-N-acetylglucosamine synthase-like glycosyltransferase
MFALLSFGLLGLNYVFTKRAVDKPWNVNVDKDYLPRISIIVPTFNEGQIIAYKIKNLTKLEYPKNMMQIVFVDSNSSDSTIAQIKEFIDNNKEKMETKLLIEDQRSGKSVALNSALKNCDGEIVIISDADCFWPSFILSNAIPYMADPNVGAISGPKRLLNSEDSHVTKSENAYLQVMNLMKEGESKISSTLLFEGGFSAFKRGVIDCFDPYNTGSDDCGTVIEILEKNYRAIMVPEAEFFTVFPKTWSEKLKIKVRRANQLIQVLGKYAYLLAYGKIKTGKGVVMKNLLVYFLAPFAFLFLIATTICLLFKMPIVAVLLFFLFAVPKVKGLIFEASLNFLIILYAIVLSLFRRKFVVWRQPKDRLLLREEMLLQRQLI